MIKDDSEVFTAPKTRVQITGSTRFVDARVPALAADARDECQ